MKLYFFFLFFVLLAAKQCFAKSSCFATQRTDYVFLECFNQNQTNKPSLTHSSPHATHIHPHDAIHHHMHVQPHPYPMPYSMPYPMTNPINPSIEKVQPDDICFAAELRLNMFLKFFITKNTNPERALISDQRLVLDFDEVFPSKPEETNEPKSKVKSEQTATLRKVELDFSFKQDQAKLANRTKESIQKEFLERLVLAPIRFPIQTPYQFSEEQYEDFKNRILRELKLDGLFTRQKIEIDADKLTLRQLYMMQDELEQTIANYNLKSTKFLESLNLDHNSLSNPNHTVAKNLLNKQFVKTLLFDYLLMVNRAMRMLSPSFSIEAFVEKTVLKQITLDFDKPASQSMDPMMPHTTEPFFLALEPLKYSLIKVRHVNSGIQNQIKKILKHFAILYKTADELLKDSTKSTGDFLAENMHLPSNVHDPNTGTVGHIHEHSADSSQHHENLIGFDSVMNKEYSIDEILEILETPFDTALEFQHGWQLILSTCKDEQLKKRIDSTARALTTVWGVRFKNILNIPNLKLVIFQAEKSPTRLLKEDITNVYALQSLVADEIHYTQQVSDALALYTMSNETIHSFEPTIDLTLPILRLLIIEELYSIYQELIKETIPKDRRILFPLEEVEQMLLNGNYYDQMPSLFVRFFGELNVKDYLNEQFYLSKTLKSDLELQDRNMLPNFSVGTPGFYNTSVFALNELASLNLRGLDSKKSNFDIMQPHEIVLIVNYIVQKVFNQLKHKLEEKEMLEFSEFMKYRKITKMSALNFYHRGWLSYKTMDEILAENVYDLEREYELMRLNQADTSIMQNKMMTIGEYDSFAYQTLKPRSFRVLNLSKILDDWLNSEIVELEKQKGLDYLEEYKKAVDSFKSNCFKLSLRKQEALGAFLTVLRSYTLPCKPVEE